MARTYVKVSRLVKEMFELKGNLFLTIQQLMRIFLLKSLTTGL